MGAIENRRDSAAPVFTGFEAIFCTIVLYVFAAFLGGKRAFFKVGGKIYHLKTDVYHFYYGNDQIQKTRRRHGTLYRADPCEV